MTDSQSFNKTEAVLTHEGEIGSSIFEITPNHLNPLSRHLKAVNLDFRVLMFYSWRVSITRSTINQWIPPLPPIVTKHLFTVDYLFLNGSQV